MPLLWMLWSENIVHFYYWCDRQNLVQLHIAFDNKNTQLIKRTDISEPRSILHEKNTLLHPQVLLHPLWLGHQRESHHQKRTAHGSGKSRPLSWMLPPQLGLDLESMGARKWCEHLQKESASKMSSSITICIPNLSASSKISDPWWMCVFSITSTLNFPGYGDVRGIYEGSKRLTRTHHAVLKKI